MKFEFKENLLYLMKSCFPIRCNAEEKANALLKELDRYDIKWYNGVNLLDENYWHKYETETCYKLNLKESDWFLCVCHSNTCEQEGYRVFEFESLLVEEQDRKKENDIISHPAHYCHSKYEPKDVIRDWGLKFNLGNVVKYIARAGYKDDVIQDLKKARQYLDFEIEALEEERNKKGNNY